MSSRAWQMAAAFVSIGILIVVLVAYGLRDDTPPTQRGVSEPHAGAQHFVAAVEHMGTALAPLQLYANAKVGDWIAYRVINRSTLLPSEITTLVFAKVIALSDTTATVEYKGYLPATRELGEQWQRVLSRGNLTIDGLLDNETREWTIYDLVVGDDDRELDGRRFKCKKLTYAANDPLFPDKRVRRELWISDEVPGGGLVEDREIQDLESTHIEQIKQLIAFGTAGGTRWGTKPEGFGS